MLKSYGVSRVCGDAYAGEWPRERFATRGILYDVSQKNKSTIYSEFLPALNGRRVRLLDNPRLIGQTHGQGGRDSIDHASGSHDDVANSCCGCLVQVIADRRPALVKRTDVLAGAFGLPLPAHCNCVVAVLAVGAKDGMAAIVYSATTFSGPELLILDFDLVPLHGSLFRNIDGRACELSGICRAQARITFVPEPLKRHAERAGIICSAIPEEMEPEELLLSAANHTSRGAIKLCEPALAKTRTSPFQGAMDFRFGEDTDSPLRQASLWTIALALDIPE